MNTLFVVNQLREWPLDLPGVDVVTARAYLTESGNGEADRKQVYNLCRTNRYQGRGYYVSLVAEARGDLALPNVKVIEDVQSGNLEHLQREHGSARPIAWALPADGGETLQLDAHFGRDPQRVHDAASRQLFELLDAPLIRAWFERIDGRWQLRRARLLSAAKLSPAQRAFALEAASASVAPARAPSSPRPPAIAILFNESERDRPSNAAALEAFRRTASKLGMRAEIISRDDIERVPQFDALFIRDTTHVNHYTYQFARRAGAAGLVVIDDPDSILKCGNKVYLNELLSRHHIAGPKTLLVQRDNASDIVPMLGLPCILKRPDSAFSLGVAKVETREALTPALDALFTNSDLLVAQEWLPTEFDWRVGVLDRRPLFVCKYLMAPGHWQVVKREPGRKLEGATIALAVGEAPQVVVNTAVEAANLIGDGLYGVDLKQVGDRCYVIEVNDNPNIDAGNEDGVLGDALYREVMGVFLRRIREGARDAAA